MRDYQDENVLTKVTPLYSYIVRIFRKEDNGYLTSKKIYNDQSFKDEFKFNPYEFIMPKKNSVDIVDPAGFVSKFIRHYKEIRSFTKNNDMTNFELSIKFKETYFVITIIDSKTHKVELKVLVSIVAEFIEEKLYEYAKTFQDTDDYQPPVIKSPLNSTSDKEELIPVYRAHIGNVRYVLYSNK